MKKILFFISRILVGILFTFSGFVKCIDPIGTGYKFEDYFIAMGLDGLIPMAFFFSVLLCGAELLIGILLIMNVATRIVSWFALGFMILFTPLTLWLAVANPISDCGCFGDAVVMSNWQTFFKNIVLLAFVIMLFAWRKMFKPWVGPLAEILGIAGIIALITLFELSNVNNLPLLDFRPYKIGNNIPELMTVPEGAPRDQFESVFIYEKDGEKREFTDINNLPQEPWKWVDTRTTLIKKGYEPPIHDFSVITEEGMDITEYVLNAPHPIFLLISYDLDKSSSANIEQLKDIESIARLKSADFIVLTSSLTEEIQAYKEAYDLNWKFCNTDQTTLKTIIRSNPGLLLLKNGIIMNKWHHKHLPDSEELSVELHSIH